MRRGAAEEDLNPHKLREESGLSLTHTVTVRVREIPYMTCAILDQIDKSIHIENCLHTRYTFLLTL